MAKKTATNQSTTKPTAKAALELGVMHKQGIHMLRQISVLLLSFFIISKVFGDQPENYEKVVDAVAFKTKIVGTTWSYQWRSREYIFSFHPDGSIEKLDSWSSVSWSINQPLEVILDAGSSKMYLFFNSEATSFRTVDWDGQRATGVKVFNDYK